MRKVRYALSVGLSTAVTALFLTVTGVMGTSAAYAQTTSPSTACTTQMAGKGGVVSTCAGGEDCTPAPMGGESCAPPPTPTKPESWLYSQLNTAADNLAMLNFIDSYQVEVTLKKAEAQGKVFDIDVGDGSDQQNIRNLALSKGVHFQVGTSGSPEYELYTNLTQTPGIITGMTFHSSSVVVDYVSDGRKTYTIGGGADEDALRKLAEQNNVPFSTAAAPGQPDGTETAIIVVLVFLSLIVLGIIAYLWNRRKEGAGGAGQTANANVNNNNANGQPPRLTGPGGGGGMMQLRAASPGGGKQKKNAVETPGVPVVTFADVIGQKKAKKALVNILKLNQNPEVMAKHDARIPKGVLLAGGPGLGKTHLARALAGESGLTMFQINAARFIEQFVGVGAKRVRELCEQAAKKSEELNELVIIYIDEIDAIGTKRRGGGGGDDEKTQTLNELLGFMDGYEGKGRLLFVGSTNRFNELDPALVRAGRFDEKVTLKAPSHDERVQMFQYYLQRKLTAELDYQELARKSSGMSGASIANVCNFAAVAVALDEIDGPEGHEPVITQQIMLEEIQFEHDRQPKNSVARRLSPSENKVRMKDVIGQDGAKELCQDLLDYFAAPHKFAETGTPVPRGTLFKGGPGEGKTLLAQAVAGEAGVPFFVAAGSDFVQGIVGHGAKNVRELWEEATANAPCLVFIDEIDAVGGKRAEQSLSGGDQERANTLNQLLVCIDGAGTKDNGVVIIAATNRPDMLDDALLRPGRFDRSVELTAPDYNARLALFEKYMDGKKLADDVDLAFFARHTAGLSAAAIANVCNEAWLYQRRLNRKGGKDGWDVTITAEALDDGIQTQVMGGTANRLLSQDELLNTAVHEIGGHACVHHVVSGGEEMVRMTIIGRGKSLGHVMYKNDDKYSWRKHELLNRITSALAGREAQDMLLGTIDTGAAQDYEQAYGIAEQMVVKWGMSPLGVIIRKDGVPLSDKKLAAIDEAIETILADCTERARRIIRENEHRIWFIVDAIMDKETLLGPEFQALWEEAGKLDPSTAVFKHKPKGEVERHDEISLRKPAPVVVAEPEPEVVAPQPVRRGQVIDAGKLFDEPATEPRRPARTFGAGLAALLGRRPKGTRRDVRQ